jgi:UDP-N-acetylmuramoyl-tripeptide--D-alanyl-D-alanine ligase
VTPGMVELGDAHDAEHARIGECAAKHVDIFLPVLPHRLSSMIASYVAGAPAGLVVPQATLQDALTWVDANLKAGDALLLENDLPDLYERKLRL